METIPEKMKAIIKTSKGVELREVSTPQIKKSEVLVKVKKAGICGTDLAIYKDNYETPEPLIMGHEFSGIVKAGDEEWIDKKVTSEINITCGKCYFCKKGLSHHCENRDALGITVDGCFADYVKVPEENLHEIPFSYEKGSFVEPVAAAIQTTKKTKIEEKDNVLILGCGRLGLLVLQVMKIIGADVYATDRNEGKVEIASSLGATIVSLDDEDLPRFDVIVEATGNPKALNQALEIVKPKGTIALKSTPGVPFEVDMSLVAQKEISIEGSRCGPFDEAISYLKDERIKIQNLISNRFELKEYEKAFEAKGIKNIFNI